MTTLRKTTAAGATLLGITTFASPIAVAEPAADAVSTDRVVVSYHPGTVEARSERALTADAADKSRATDQSLRYRFRMPTGEAVFDLGGPRSGAEVAEVLAAFRADPAVAHAEPDLLMKPLGLAPDDPEYHRQWDLFEPTAGMNVPAAWSTSTGKDVNVAVVDSGYVKHADLDANVEGGFDFITNTGRSRDGDGYDPDPTDQGDWEDANECAPGEGPYDSSWHGTHVAGTIAAVTGNDKGIAGIAPDATITPVRVLGRCGGSALEIAIGMLWAAGVPLQDTAIPPNPNPAEVINLSLGGKSATCPWFYQRTIDRVRAKGATVVVAAGNSGIDAADFTPANCAGVITVAATNREGGKSWYSNFGSTVEVSAPGGETRRATDKPGTVTTPEKGIWSTVNAGKTTATIDAYKPYQGTSMAAPHIAGLAALIKSVRPEFTPDQVAKAITDNARPLPGPCPAGCGAGIADAAKTLASLGDGGASTYASTSTLAIPDNGPAVASEIVVTGRAGNAPAVLKVAVEITHSWRGDVVVDLVAPDGTVYPLKSFSANDSADDIRTTYAVDASTELANGTWRLRVQDRAELLAGRLMRWSLIF